MSHGSTVFCTHITAITSFVDLHFRYYPRPTSARLRFVLHARPLIELIILDIHAYLIFGYQHLMGRYLANNFLRLSDTALSNRFNKGDRSPLARLD